MKNHRVFMDMWNHRVVCGYVESQGVCGHVESQGYAKCILHHELYVHSLYVLSCITGCMCILSPAVSALVRTTWMYKKNSNSSYVKESGYTAMSWRWHGMLLTVLALEYRSTNTEHVLDSHQLQEQWQAVSMPRSRSIDYATMWVGLEIAHFSTIISKL